MAPRKDTDYLAISARIRAMENRMLTREKLERLVDARDTAEARKLLTECGYSDGGSLEEALAKARAEVFRDMASAVPDPRLTEVFQLKYDCHNAKTILKAEAMLLRHICRTEQAQKLEDALAGCACVVTGTIDGATCEEYVDALMKLL